MAAGGRGTPLVRPLEVGSMTPFGEQSGTCIYHTALRTPRPVHDRFGLDRPLPLVSNRGSARLRQGVATRLRALRDR
jgi:hypothetical protein